MASVTSTSFDTSVAAVQAVSWAIATAGDTGVRVNLSGFPDKTVQVTGTFGSVTLRGSNLANPSDANSGDWFTLTDPQGNALTFAAADGATISENPLWLSPITVGGSGYTIVVVGIKE